MALAIAELPSKPQVIGTGRRPDRLEELAKAGLEAIPFELSADIEYLKKSVDDIVAKYPEVKMNGA